MHKCTFPLKEQLLVNLPSFLLPSEEFIWPPGFRGGLRWGIRAAVVAEGRRPNREGSLTGSLRLTETSEAKEPPNSE